MDKLRILKGSDFKTAYWDKTRLRVTARSTWSFPILEDCRPHQVASVVVVSQGVSASLGSTAAFATIGGVIAGPFGAVAGMVVAPGQRDITIFLTCNSGQVLAATVKAEVYVQMLNMGYPFR